MPKNKFSAILFFCFSFVSAKILQAIYSRSEINWKLLIHCSFFWHIISANLKAIFSCWLFDCFVYTFEQSIVNNLKFFLHFSFFVLSPPPLSHYHLTSFKLAFSKKKKKRKCTTHKRYKEIITKCKKKRAKKEIRKKVKNKKKKISVKIFFYLKAIECKTIMQNFMFWKKKQCFFDVQILFFSVTDRLANF